MVAIIALALVVGPAYSGRVVTAEAVVAEISSAMHQPIRLAPHLSKILVYIEPHGASNEETLTALADAVNGSIHYRNALKVIERTQEDLLKLHKRRTEERASWIQKRISGIEKYRTRSLRPRQIAESISSEVDRQAKQWSELSLGTSNSLSPYRAAELMPSEALLEQLVERIGPREIGAIPSGETRIFEDQPAFGASALPPHIDLTERFVAGVQPFQSVNLNDQVKQKASMMSMGDVIQTAVGPGEPLRLRLQAQCDENQVNINLDVYNSQGNRVAGAWLDCGPTEQHLSPVIVMRRESQRPDVRWLNLSPKAVETFAFATNPVPQVEAPEWLIHPDRIDPLNQYVSEILHSYASDQAPKCFAATVSDSMWLNVRHAVQFGRVNLNALNALMAEWTPYERLESSLSVVMRPKDPEIDEKRRANRKVLGSFARDLLATRSCDVRKLGIFLHTVSSELAQLGDAWLFPILRDIHCQQAKGGFSDRLLAFVGSIPDTTWQELLGGKTASVRRLGIGADLKNELLQDIGAPIQGDASFPDMWHHADILYGQADFSETFITVLSAPERVFNMVEAGTPDQQPWNPVGTLSRFFYIPPGNIRWKNDFPTVSIQRDEFEHKYDHLQFRLGYRNSLTLIVHLPQSLYIRANAASDLVPDPVAINYKDLPQALKDENWRAAHSKAIADAFQRRDSRITIQAMPAKTPPP